jgi:hypothetical protein
MMFMLDCLRTLVEGCMLRRQRSADPLQCVCVKIVEFD